MSTLTRITVAFLLGSVLSANAEQSREAIARSHIEKVLTKGGYGQTAFDGLRVSTQHTSPHNGVTHVYYQQTYKGLDIVDGTMGVHIDRRDDVVAIGNRFKKQLVEKTTKKAGALLAPSAAASAAAAGLGIESENPLVMIEQMAGIDKACVLDGGDISQDPIPAKLKYFADVDGNLVKVWDLVIRPFSNDHWWHVQVDAETGVLLSRTDWVKYESYRVFKLPLTSPGEGGRTLEVDPYDPTASPFGWHDTDGIAGAEVTDTRGNNVFAQDDLDANDFGGFRPNGGVGLNFDFELDLTTNPTNNISPTVAQLFYLNNILHDLHYQYGFTEAAGNFQQNNYGRGGVGGDAVIADALDGSGFNNANFATPVDGSDPRMQMFVWRFASLDVSTPMVISGSYFAGSAEFGEQLIDAFLTGAVVQAYDAVNTNGPSIMDGCSILTNAAEVAGNIALIDRGGCFFIEKVKAAQIAGAVGAIVVNHLGDDVITMGGDDPSITIPSIFIGQSDGTTLRAQLNNGVTVTMSGGSVGSSFDNGIVVHEYGHGVSIRLTGGAGNSGCLDGIQSGGMGEGWSDWWALVLTATASETHLTAHGVGTFVSGTPPDSGGIRSNPYSTDKAVMPLTYSSITNSSEVHIVGEIWSGVLWDMYWNLVLKHGFDPDYYFGNGGNNIALQLVMDGLKMQPCNPTFLDARDAILAADAADYGGANACEIWRAFARRGMGVNATDGGSHNSISVVEDYSIPVECKEPLIVFDPQASPFEVSWLARDDGTYRVQQSASLLNPVWTNVSGIITSPGIIASAQVNSNSTSTVLLRVVLEE